ncbi:MAG: M23 family metallopeptidase [Clostridia bacterium]|nr:M23 family metallopeptidase [Clostridia bacterium]
MMLNDENKRSIKKMLRGRALYVALSACVMAAAVIALRAAGSKTLKNLASEVTTRESVTHLRITSDQTEAPSVPETPVSEAPTAASGREPATRAVFENLSPTVPATAEPASDEPTEAVSIRFQLPLGVEIGKDYSMGVPVFSETMNDWRTHNGVDFTGSAGDAVQTIAPGTVASVVKDPLWGNVVTVDHGGGVISTLSGLADAGLVSAGSYVSAGDVIGTVGEIPVERGDGAHIHLEIRVNGALRDPLEVMGFVSDRD